jgi:CBS domain-containing protein
MFSQRIRKVMDPAAMVTVGPHATVSQAAQLIAGHAVGAVLVVQDDALLGIFTASDAVRRVLAKGLDPGLTPLSDVMSTPVRTVEPEATFGSALQLMHEHALRQVPVVEGGKPIGVLCARDALDPEMEEFAVEAQRREAYEHIVHGQPVEREPKP